MLTTSSRGLKVVISTDTVIDTTIALKDMNFGIKISHIRASSGSHCTACTNRTVPNTISLTNEPESTTTVQKRQILVNISIKKIYQNKQQEE